MTTPKVANVPHRLAGALLLLGLLGCDPRPPPVAPPPLDDPDDAIRVRIAGIELPRLPTDVAADDHELEDGIALAEEALTMPAPRPPSGALIEVEEWADQELPAWMQRRARAVSAAQRALDPARHGRPEYSVVASALLGVVYARFAMDLRGIATPEVFTSDPDRVDSFREAMEASADPLWQRALDAFGSCSSVAGGQPAHSLDNWREWCDGEIRTVSVMLPDRADDRADD